MLGWYTPIISTIIIVAILGVEGASVVCERPFARVPSMSHVDIEEINLNDIAIFTP